MTAGLKIYLAQLNPTVGDLSSNATKIRESRDNAPAGTDLIVFPEMVVTGYPVDDLVLNESFLRHVQNVVDEIVRESTGSDVFMTLTAPMLKDGRIYNALHVVGGGKIHATILKHNLPNYGIFDDKRVFDAGPLPEPVTVKGYKIGFMICEDVWFPEPAANLKKHGAEILIVPNASPYAEGKHGRRYETTRARVKETGLPLIYVNQVGGQDDLVFDGASFVMDAAGKITEQLPFFEEYCAPAEGHIHEHLSPEEEIYSALTLALRDYVHKNGFKGVLIGMSGGIDSALSAVIAADALGSENVHCVMMPSPFTSQDSLDDAKECSDLLGVKYEVISIEAALKAYESSLTLSGTAHENIQSRIRGNILMALSNKTGAMVLSTGNKSEMAMGYATLYGDMCGGFNAIKDIYKTMVYRLANWRNKTGRVIPGRIITKAPTAELKAKQTDQDTLPPYDILDAILHGLIEEDLGVDEITAEGFDRDMVSKIARMLEAAEYKRRQAPPGPKITAKAFGRDRRYPITNGYIRNIEKPAKTS